MEFILRGSNPWSVAELYSRRLSAISRIRRTERFLDRQSPASAFQDGLICARVHKLESEAESVSLADKCKNLNLSERQGEFESNYLAHGNLGPQHGRDAGLADIDGVSSNYRRIARIDANLDLKLESRVAPRFGRRVRH